LIKKISDFEKLLILINQHGLDPILYMKLKKYKNILNETFLDNLKTNYINIAKNNMLLSSELISLNNLFIENNLNYLSFKGPSLSLLAYGDVISRRYLDLDILVKKEDLEDIYKMLIKNGYTTDIKLENIKDDRFLDISKDMIFYNNKKNVVIEVHWKLLEKRFFSQNFSFNDFAWKKELYVKVNNIEIPTFDKEYLVFYLIIHGSKHFWERIEWLYNIYLLLIKYEDIDLKKIVEYSKTMQTDMMLKIFFTILKNRFDYIVDSNLIKLDKKSFKLAKEIEENWTTLEMSEDNMNFKEIKFIIKMQDNLINKIKVSFKTIFQIKVYDILYINLPQKFTFVYYLIRPFRFFFDFFRRKKC
jgi:hypothetical protein